MVSNAFLMPKLVYLITMVIYVLCQCCVFTKSDEIWQRLYSVVLICLIWMQIIINKLKLRLTVKVFSKHVCRFELVSKYSDKIRHKGNKY